MAPTEDSRNNLSAAAAPTNEPTPDLRDIGRARHLKGTLIVLCGVLFFTPDSLTIKKVRDEDGLKTVWWRMLFYTVVTGSGILAVKARQHGCARALRVLAENVRGMGWLGLAIACSHGLIEVLFCVSQKLTTTANVLVVLASSPLWAALQSWVALGETLPLRTSITIVIGILAVVYVFVGEMVLHDDGDESHAGDTANQDTALGLILANFCSFFLAAQLVMFRFGSLKYERAEDFFLPALPCGSLLGLPIVAALGASPFNGSWDFSDFGWCLLGGGVCIPVALAAMSIGASYIPAPEVSLLMLIETIGGPIWVWAVIGEEPSFHTAVAGCILIVALATHAWLGLKRDKNGQHADGEKTVGDSLKYADEAP